MTKLDDAFLDKLDKYKNELARAVADEIISVVRRSGLEMSERAQEALHRDLVVRVKVDIL
jgi:hypothetical protein